MLSVLSFRAEDGGRVTIGWAAKAIRIKAAAASASSGRSGRSVRSDVKNCIPEPGATAVQTRSSGSVAPPGPRGKAVSERPRPRRAALGSDKRARPWGDQTRRHSYGQCRPKFSYVIGPGRALKPRPRPASGPTLDEAVGRSSLTAAEATRHAKGSFSADLRSTGCFAMAASRAPSDRRQRPPARLTRRTGGITHPSRSRTRCPSARPRRRSGPPRPPGSSGRRRCRASDAVARCYGRRNRSWPAPSSWRRP